MHDRAQRIFHGLRNQEKPRFETNWILTSNFWRVSYMNELDNTIQFWTPRIDSSTLTFRSALMKHIDEPRLEADVAYRVEYLGEFMGFGGDDIQAIHAAAGVLGPVVPALVDAVYEKLFSYDATKRHFVPRQSGYTGPVPVSVESLTMDHEMIQFRKNHLARYLAALVTRPYDDKMIGYLDLVGKMHTPKAGSPDLDVPLVQMNALMGFVADP